jgi:hypothetical protein
MTEIEATEYAKKNNILENAISLVAFSNGMFFINSDILSLQKQANTEGLEFYLLKGNLPNPQTSTDGTSGTEIQ